nr:DUF4376 domain-containing protein [uncultured Undibacterium sp.]
MKKHYLIEAETGLAIWCGDVAPILTETLAICGDDTFLCYSNESASALEADEVDDFAQRKYLAIGKNLVIDPSWIEPVIDLAPIKAAKNLQINEWRSNANLTSFTHAGKRIACDALSRSDIEGVAGNISLLGAFPAGFPNAWKAMDNTYILLPTIAAFKDMYASMTAQGTINFGHSQDLKLALANAETAQEIDDIKWEI